MTARTSCINLLGVGVTVIMQAVPPGGGLALHYAGLNPAISLHGKLGRVIFGSRGLRSRAPFTIIINRNKQ